MALENYKKNQEGVRKVEYVPSGVQSDNSDAEMMVIKPYESHPEMPELYRAVDLKDPKKPWYGWVKFTPPVPKPVPPPPPTRPTPEERARKAYAEKVETMRQYLRAVEMGTLSSDDARIVALKQELKVEFKDEYIKEFKD